MILILALICSVAFAGPVQRLLVDPDVSGYPLVTEDAAFYLSHCEGLYGVVYHAKVVAADTLEFTCVNGALVTNRLLSCRIMFSDTLPTLTTTLPIEVLVYRTSTYGSAGTALTEFRMAEAEAGTITSAWTVDPVNVNGTLVAAYWVNSGEWFELPEYLEMTGTFTIGAVLAQKSYVSFEAIWTEVE
jgi:hypothetical protein